MTGRVLGALCAVAAFFALPSVAEARLQCVAYARGNSDVQISGNARDWWANAAGTYSRGVILQCGEGEAVRHFKDGMLKCAPAMEVPDCTERTNLRKFGTGDMFFTYRSTVCANSVRSTSREADMDEMTLNGGVGDNGY